MIYVIIGPTASGKSDVANNLATFLNCELINADAFQIYKDMNIGTNKIDVNDPIRKKYHLLDIVTPEETYSVKQYQDDARKVLNPILKAKKDVIIVGGTGLYIKALLYDYIFSDEETSVNTEYEKLDNVALYDLLNSKDPKEAEKIHVNNRKRLLRALTLMDNNNISKSDLLAKQNHEYFYPKELIKIIYISPEREQLYKNINNRVISMVENGLIDEVKALSKKYNLSITSKQGIGYKEVLDYLDGLTSKEECISLIQKRTRNYAKRQDTFFKNQFTNYKKYSSKEECLKDLIKL